MKISFKKDIKNEGSIRILAEESYQSIRFRFFVVYPKRVT